MYYAALSVPLSAGIHHTYLGLLERGKRKPTTSESHELLGKSYPRSSPKPNAHADIEGEARMALGVAD
jgi:hypothetical protein